MALELDVRPYFQLVHCMLRDNGSEAEIERTEQAMQWLARTRETVDRVTSQTEMRMLGLIWKAWRETKTCPTRVTIETLVRDNPKPGALIDLLALYDEHAKSLKTLTHADMELILAQRVKEYEEQRMKKYMAQMNFILDGSVPNPDKNAAKIKPELSGVEDSIAYFMAKLQGGMKIKGEQSKICNLAEQAPYIESWYSRNVAQRETGGLVIPTGISVIDRHNGGNRRGEFSAILGYTGQRKSAVLRTMGYFAALSGFRVLHIPLESTTEEETTIYMVIHAHSGRFEATYPEISVSRFQNGDLTTEESEFLQGPVLEDFRRTVAQNITIFEPAGERTWAETKLTIELECLKAPVDLVLLDYLTMLKPPPDPGKDETSAIMRMIQDAKRLCLNANDGKGLSLVTPVQGNRKGLEDATNNDGAWDVTGIARYSEMDKSLDNCYYVYTNDDLSGNNELKLGSCKMRRNKNIVSSFVRIEPRAGSIVSSSQKLGSAPKARVSARSGKDRGSNRQLVSAPASDAEVEMCFDVEATWAF